MINTNPFENVYDLQQLFDNRAGSRIADRRTYVPTGRIEQGTYWDGYRSYLSVTGSRSFNANEFDYMIEWMAQYEHDTTALEMLNR